MDYSTGAFASALKLYPGEWLVVLKDQRFCLTNV